MEVIKLNLKDEPKEEKRPGFWKRQFAQEPTRKQTIFDWAYGVVIPTICVALDPIVFRSSIGFQPLPGFSQYKAFAYVLSFASIMAMAAWLLWGKKLGGLAAPIAGLFVFGSFVSFAVGVLLVPYSSLGLIVGIGLLGFTPLFSAVVFLRNGVRAHRSSVAFLGGKMTLGLALFGALYSLAIPFVVHSEITRRVDNIAYGDLETMRRETAILKPVSLLVDAEPLARNYRRPETPQAAEPPRMKQLADSYQELTGDEIYSRFLD